MAELGWYGLCIPEEYGGSGGSFLDATLFLEEFTRGQAPVAAYAVTLIVVGAGAFGSSSLASNLVGPTGTVMAQYQRLSDPRPQTVGQVRPSDAQLEQARRNLALAT